MAIGSGWMLPWVTFTCSAADAWPRPHASIATKTAQTQPKDFITISKLLWSQHFSGIKPEGIDLSPLLIPVRRQFVRCTSVDGAPCGLGRRLQERIATHGTGRISSQLWRLCDRPIRIEEKIKADDETLGVRRSHGRIPARLDLAPQRVLKIGRHRRLRADTTHGSRGAARI